MQVFSELGIHLLFFICMFLVYHLFFTGFRLYAGGRGWSYRVFLVYFQKGITSPSRIISTKRESLKIAFNRELDLPIFIRWIGAICLLFVIPFDWSWLNVHLDLIFMMVLFFLLLFLTGEYFLLINFDNDLSRVKALEEVFQIFSLMLLIFLCLQCGVVLSKAESSPILIIGRFVAGSVYFLTVLSLMNWSPFGRSSVITRLIFNPLDQFRQELWDFMDILAISGLILIGIQFFWPEPETTSYLYQDGQWLDSFIQILLKSALILFLMNYVKFRYANFSFRKSLSLYWMIFIPFLIGANIMLLVVVR